MLCNRVWAFNSWVRFRKGGLTNAFIRRHNLECENSSCSNISNPIESFKNTESVDNNLLLKTNISLNKISNLLAKEKTIRPFTELPEDNEIKEEHEDFYQYVDSLGPPLPVSFNLAAFINRSQTLQKFVQLGVDLSALENDPEKAKFILKLDFEKDVENHIQFLCDKSVAANELGRIITKNPFIFKISVENLQIRINYLLSKKFSKSSVARIITRNPFHLACSTKTVDTRLGFLQKSFELSGDEVRCIITKCPKLVTYNYEKLMEKNFIVKEIMGFSFKEIKQLLIMKPKVFMLGGITLKERFNIIHNEMGISHERILQYPGILLRRSFLLKQRHQYLVHLGQAQYDSTKPGYISLLDITTTTDNAFCKKCARTTIQEYNEFLKTL